MSTNANGVRAVRGRDADVLSRLARLADRARPTGRALLAEHEGVAIAAVTLTSGSVIADPTRDTAGAIRALRLRRYQFLRQGGEVAPAFVLCAR